MRALCFILCVAKYAQAWSRRDRAFVFAEDTVAVSTSARPATDVPEPPIRLHEIDEALAWSVLTYAPRDKMWHRWVDHLLDQRLRLTASDPANTEPR